MQAQTEFSDISMSPALDALSPSGASTERVKLHDRLVSKQAVIGVIGLGYVGLPLALSYAENGFLTRGIDLNPNRVMRLNAGLNGSSDIDGNALRAALQARRFTASEQNDGLASCDVIFICVPTPVTHHKAPDTSCIEDAARSVAEHLRPGQLVILRSTTYPETPEGLVQPILEAAAGKQDLLLGRDYFLAFSPERIDPGNSYFNTENTPVVVGGVTEACTELAALALEQVSTHIHTVSSPKVAELEKLLENIFRSVNIALVNELAQLCDRMGGISIWEVVEAAATKPFGFMPFTPGPGIGGHCIPIDPYYLSWLSRKHDFETSFITLAARVNEDMPFYVGKAVLRAVANQPVRLRDAKVLILGVSFKKDVDDTRHAPAEKVFEILQSQGIKHLAYSDPHVPTYTVRTPAGPKTLESVPMTQETLQEHDVVVILTDHSSFQYAQIAKHARTVVDTRNALKDIPHDRDKVMLLGGGRF
jgi:UDP-N-acetyl-D-glucosamine dehydrogenase